jgi:ATP-dependent Clp protease ATP-binding subunit ClpC
MPKINVYLPDELAAAVRDAQLPVSSICQAALERAVRDVAAARGAEAAVDVAEPAIGLLGRFTPRARAALERAGDAARETECREVGTEHVLIGVIDEGQNLAIRVLDALEVEPADLRVELVAAIRKSGAPPAGHVPFSDLAKRALETTTKEALTLGHNYIGCEHLLLGVLATDDGAAKVMQRMGIELRTTRLAVMTALAGVVHQRAQPTEPVSGSALEQILRRLDAIERRLPETA